MTNYTKLYWLTRLDSLNALAGITLGLSIAFLIFTILYAENTWDEDDTPKIYKATKPYRILAWILIPISLLTVVFVPTQKEAILIIAGGKAMDYVQSDTSLAKLPYQTTTIISEYMDKTIKEIKQ